MRAVIVVIWCAVLAVFDFYLVDRLGPPTSWKAQHEMVAGHLLEPGDLGPAPLSGRYLLHDVTKDQPISAGDVTEAPPLIEQQPGTVLVALPVPRGVVTRAGLNARGKAQLCRSGQVSLPSVEVKSVICPAGEGTCTAIVGIPLDQAAKAAPDKAGSAVVTVQQPGATCP